MKEMSKKNSILVLLVAILAGAFLIFTAVCGWGKTEFGSAGSIKLGLDLAGGVSITYQAKGEVAPDASDMNDTVYKLQKRVNEYSTEAQVYRQGENRITVEIPGVKDASAILEELGKPGALSIQNSDGEVLLSGTDIKDAQASTQQGETGATEYVVELYMTDEATSKFAEITQEYMGQSLPIVYDGEIISNPTVQAVISNGIASITGMESYEEAENLAAVIRIGGLKVELEELESKVVGAQLGQDAIRTSLLAAAIGLVIIMILMCVLYRLPGFVASLALIIYTSLILVALAYFDLTLTLSGIAGIILSIGMAVDANVIIFARIREEVTAGRPVFTAISTGFSKALSAIVDGNITTLIAAAVLAFKGTGSVQGFAQTLALGIVLSMFTALVVTKFMLRAFYGLGFKDVKWYGVNKERKTIDFLSKKHIFLAISGLVICIGIGFMAFNQASGNGAFALGLDFQGGTSTTAEFKEEMTIADIEAKVNPVVTEATGETNVMSSTVEGTSQVVIKTKTLTLEERDALSKALVDNFGIDEATITYESISSTISSEMQRDAVIAVIIATICMLIYIWFRFKDVRFASSAVIALLHDVLIVIAFYAVARLTVGSDFIACILTIVGYSINATIVIFDRIRENLADANKKTDLAEVVNRSITQTLSRSIYTSVTTFVMVAMLFILGVSSIRAFALPLMVGIVCGAYSSVCITGALYYLMKTKIQKKEK